MRAIWFLLSGLCHQMPEHSLIFGGRALPLCARCTGLFTGAVLTALTLWAMGQGRRAGFPTRRLGALMGAFALGWLVDSANSFLSYWRGQPFLYMPSNALRLATGLGMGFGVGVLLYSITHQVLGEGGDAQPPLGERGSALIPLAANAAWAAMLLGWRKAPYGVLLGAVALAAYGTLAWVNALLWGVLLGDGEHCARRQQFLWPLALGALSALAEMALLASLRRLLGA